MKHLLIVIAVLGLALELAVRAEGPDDKYVQLYNLILQADEQNQTGQKRTAFEQYQQAKTALENLSKAFPDWKPSLIQFRLNYVNSKLTQFGPPPAATPPVAAPGALAPAGSSAANVLEKPLPAGEITHQIKTLTEQLRLLSTDKATLEAKLREALSAQPATVEPRQLAKAEERIRALEKENELLKVSLQQDHAKLSKWVDPAVLEAVQKDLAEANRKLAEQNQAIAALTQEKQILQSRTQTPAAAAPAVPAPAPSAPAPSAPAPAAKVATTPGGSAQIDLLQTENDFLKRRIEDLEGKTMHLVPETKPTVGATAAGKVAGDANPLVSLKQERDELQKKLEAATKELKDSKSKKATGQTGKLGPQLASLQSRLDAMEARKTPYTEEELALFKAPEPAVAATRSPEEKPASPAPKKAAHELPAGAGALVAEAQRAFAAKRYSEAEQKYKQVLSLDEKNLFTLGNLAAIQLEQQRFAEAETNLTRALELGPDDAYNLSLWGILKFRQGKYDEALDALSRSAKMDPANAETQNYLGITLSQKGQREAAEAALRKAIQIAPNYGSAHHNLAIIYATQKPPFIALARYHYQKSIALGHPRNADLEKILDSAIK